MKYFLVLILVVSLLNCSNEEEIITTTSSGDESTYFPPINSNEWETKSPESLNWNTSNLNDLYTFLEEKNSKSFIILHKGKIVVEYYMNNHTEASLWYWASAGKTLTTAVTGIAQDNAFLNINNKVSDYLGTGWTNATLEQENLITCKNLLNMTSGLDDTLGDDTSPGNLQYLSDANTRWAYHNVYVKLQDIVASATNQTWNNYFESALKNRIGMSGSWIPLNDLSVYWSNTRSMARFGLLSSKNGKWDNTQVISESFLDQATNTSQNINNAYGYLWWLNGKQNFHLPQSQIQFNGELIPNAPTDMYCALGKNDQKIYIIPSKDLVLVRMGNTADSDNFGLSTFDNDLWEKINNVIN
ncbi:serine hydrolase domain-containing protein [Aurantibacter sp.]|uniref:serine hydrolase domain-containing protein n=1 Tax=Aurantibacter sp. TaxID=2807103 RepID=UPI0035C78BCD